MQNCTYMYMCDAIIYFLEIESQSSPVITILKVATPLNFVQQSCTKLNAPCTRRLRYTRRLLAEKSLTYDKAFETAQAVEASEQGTQDLKAGLCTSHSILSLRACCYWKGCEEWQCERWQSEGQGLLLQMRWTRSTFLQIQRHGMPILQQEGTPRACFQSKATER